MIDQTPLQKLDDAIHEFFQATDTEGAVNGWVLAYQSSTLTDQPELLPLAFASDYTMGPSTSGELAMGLARVTIRRIEDQLTGWVDDDDDE